MFQSPTWVVGSGIKLDFISTNREGEVRTLTNVQKIGNNYKPSVFDKIYFILFLL